MTCFGEMCLGSVQLACVGKVYTQRMCWPGRTRDVHARADLGGGGEQGVGSPPPFQKWFPPFFEEIIPMILNFIIRLS